MIKNTYKVPKKQWQAWSKMAQVVFNRCYDHILNNQEIMKHPKAESLPATQWETFAWNSAWSAATELDNLIVC